MKKAFIVLAAMATGLISFGVQAATQIYEFQAVVDYSDGSLSGVNVGSTFTGRFVGVDPLSGGLFIGTEYTFGPDSEMTADIGGHSVVSNRLGARVYDNLGGNVEDGLSLDGYSVTVDGITYSDGGVLAINLTTLPGHTDVINGPALPTSINLADFDGPLRSLTYGVLQRDGTQTGTILQFTVTAMTASSVPELSTASGMLMGLGLMGALAWGRRRGQMAQS